jgi:glycogen synthase
VDPDLAGIQDCVVVPEDAIVRLRTRLALSGTEKPRIAYVAGPGDVIGTFEQWVSGRHDSRVPVVTYSEMFYSLARGVDAEALVLHEMKNGPRQEVPGFNFIGIKRNRSHSGSIGYAIEELLFARRVAKQIRKFKPHVLVLMTDAPALTMFLVPRKTRIILSAHNTYWPMGRKPAGLVKQLKLHAIALALRRTTAAVCTSPACAAQIAELTEKAANLFVETPQIAAGVPAPRPNGTSAARQLLFAGRVEEYKGVFDVLRAFEELWREFPDLKLSFAGSGGAQQELAKQVSGSPAREQLRILGQLPSGELLTELQCADLLVCPTRSTFNEGLALVVLEAAACGTPSVASSVVPAKELAGQACVEFEADDVNALTSAIRSVISDPERFQELKQATSGFRDQMLDRKRSWGSCLYNAMVC